MKLRTLIVSRLVFSLFAGILVWAFYNFGATQTPLQYRLFLILLIAALIGVLGLPLGRLQKGQFLPFFTGTNTDARITQFSLKINF